MNSKNEASLFINNLEIGRYTASIPWHPRGGVVVANGHKNVIMFREFKTFSKG